MARGIPYPTVYGVWANKGDVGSTTLSFHMATTYAQLFPNKAVVAIDMCPQTNLSAALLTKSTQTERKPGAGLVKYMQDNTKAHGQIPETVGGLLMARLQSETVPAERFLTNVWGGNHNPNLPSNLALVCGDSSLDLLAPELSARANDKPNKRTNSFPFKEVHCYLRDFIQGLAQYYANMKESKELVVFIDTNPALSIYTEIALCAMTELVVPASADFLSSQAIHSMYDLVYGLYPTNKPYYKLAAAAAALEKTFADKVKDSRMSMPSITAIIDSRTPVHQNPTPQNDEQYQPVVAGPMATEQCSPFYEEYVKAKSSGAGKFVRVFTVKRCAAKSPIECNNITEFAESYTATMRDMRSCGAAALHAGLPLWKLLEKVNCIDSQFRRLDFTNCVPGLMKDLLYAMELITGKTWADKDVEAWEKLKKIADQQPAQFTDHKVRRANMRTAVNKSPEAQVAAKQELGTAVSAVIAPEGPVAQARSAKKRKRGSTNPEVQEDRQGDPDAGRSRSSKRRKPEPRPAWRHAGNCCDIKL